MNILELCCVAGTLISCLIHGKIIIMIFLMSKNGYGLSLLNPKSLIATQLFFYLKTNTNIKAFNLLLYYWFQVLVR